MMFSCLAPAAALVISIWAGAAATTPMLNVLVPEGLRTKAAPCQLAATAAW